MTKKNQPAGQAQTRAVVDRIEDGIAVLELSDQDGRTIDLPVSMLPPDAEEGSHLLIVVTLDEEARRAAEARITALQEKLERRSGKEGQKNFKL
jgi:hypothetical protein